MDAMDVDVVVDIQGAIMRLIEDPESVPAHELGLLGQVFAAIHPPMMMTFMSTQGLSLTPLLAAATATVGGADDTPDPLLHLARLRVLMQMETQTETLTSTDVQMYNPPAVPCERAPSMLGSAEAV